MVFPESPSRIPDQPDPHRWDQFLREVRGWDTETILANPPEKMVTVLQKKQVHAHTSVAWVESVYRVKYEAARGQQFEKNKRAIKSWRTETILAHPPEKLEEMFKQKGLNLPMHIAWIKEVYDRTIYLPALAKKTEE